MVEVIGCHHRWLDDLFRQGDPFSQQRADILPGTPPCRISLVSLHDSTPRALRIWWVYRSAAPITCRQIAVLNTPLEPISTPYGVGQGRISRKDGGHDCGSTPK